MSDRQWNGFRWPGDVVSIVEPAQPAVPDDTWAAIESTLHEFLGRKQDERTMRELEMALEMVLHRAGIDEVAPEAVSLRCGEWPVYYTDIQVKFLDRKSGLTIQPDLLKEWIAFRDEDRLHPMSLGDWQRYVRPIR